MTSGEACPPPDGLLSPEEVARREFAPARKGYDCAEVRAFLRSVASTIETASGRIADLERRLTREFVAAGDAVGEVDDVLLEAAAAEVWRDEVLADLDRRRRELSGEVGRLRAGRDLLRADLGDVMSDVAEHVRRLDGSLQAARAAGDLEEQRIHAEPVLSGEERRAELEAARLAGFVTVGPPPVEAVAQQLPAGGGDPSEADSTSEQEPQHDQRIDVEASPPNGSAGGEVDALFARLRAERTGVPARWERRWGPVARPRLEVPPRAP